MKKVKKAIQTELNPEVIAIKDACRNYIQRKVNAGVTRERCWRLMMPFWFNNRYHVAILFGVRWRRDEWRAKRCLWNEIEPEQYWSLMDQMNLEFTNEKK